MAKIMDVHSKVLVHRFLAAKARTATETSTAFDRLAAGKAVSGRAILVLDMGEFTTGTCLVSLEHCATSGGGYVPLLDKTGAAVAFTAKGATGVFTMPVELELAERYVKAVATGASTPVYTNSVYLIAPASDAEPITNPAA